MKNLMAESVLYVTGRKKNLKITGPLKQVRAFEGVLNASRKLYEALEDNSTSLSQIEFLVEKKKIAISRRRGVYGSSK